MSAEETLPTSTRELSYTHAYNTHTNTHTHPAHSPTVSLTPLRWLDRNEDDGQIVRELVPTDDGQRLFSK